MPRNAADLALFAPKKAAWNITISTPEHTTMECLHRRIPYASWRLQVFQRLFAPSTDSNGSTPASYRTISTSSDQHDLREPTSPLNNEASPRPSQLLPQSPLATQQAEKKRKKRPTTEDLHGLSRNPWAMALASPLRMCAVSQTRVPKAFMSGWGLVQRPEEAERLWLLPVGLLKDELAPRPGKAAQAAQVQEQKDDNPAQPPETNNQKSLSFLRLRIIDRLPLLRRLTTPLARATGGKRSAIVKLVPHRWKLPFGPMTAREEGRMAWRKDMPDFVLGQMRKDVMKKLKRTIEIYQPEQDAASRVLSDVELNGQSQEALVEALGRIDPVERMGSGAVLAISPAPNSDSQSALHFSDYVTLPQVQSKVPVLDLSILLSESDLGELKGLDSRFQSTALFFRPNDSVTVDALLALWKLKCFLRHDN